MHWVSLCSTHDGQIGVFSAVEESMYNLVCDDGEGWFCTDDAIAVLSSSIGASICSDSRLIADDSDVSMGVSKLERF
jgi:hypothetical protein